MGLNDLPLLYPFDAIEANENVDGLVDEDGLTSSVGGAGLTGGRTGGLSSALLLGTGAGAGAYAGAGAGW